VMESECVAALAWVLAAIVAFAVGLLLGSQ
jgi:hypothetical protein